jgi:hypothetical protein
MKPKVAKEKGNGEEDGAQKQLGYKANLFHDILIVYCLNNGSE